MTFFSCQVGSNSFKGQFPCTEVAQPPQLGRYGRTVHKGSSHCVISPTVHQNLPKSPTSQFAPPRPRVPRGDTIGPPPAGNLGSARARRRTDL